MTWKVAAMARLPMGTLIHMALHLVARFAGVDRAREVRRYIQYDPMPPI